MRLFLPLPIFIVFAQIALAQAKLELFAHLQYDSVTLAGCWHYTSPDGVEYALVGTSSGLSIVDLSNPKKPMQRLHVPMPASNWREVKTWQNYAYVTTETPNSGVYIVDLSGLPDAAPSKVWKGDENYSGEVVTNHTLAIDNGYLYLFGGNFVAQGAVICDLSDPWNPRIVGRYDQNYIHDGFVRNDTLWAGEIYAGRFSIIDVRDKSNPVLLGSQPTPGAFNHNTWLSDDGRTLFTTDEVINGPLTAFDVSDPANIQLLDVYYPSLDPSREVHNVRVINNYLINPSYGGQLSLVDAQQPHNLVELAIVKLGNSLVWDADPYLPSGLLIATTKNEGLYVFKPTYARAASVQGLITDAATGQPVFDATISILNTPAFDQSAVDGAYHTGIAQSGSYTIEVEKYGYELLTLNDVKLTNGQITHLDLALKPSGAMAGAPGRFPANKGIPSPFNKDNQNADLAAASTRRQLRAPQAAAAQTGNKQMFRTNLQAIEVNDLDHLPNAMYHLQKVNRANLVKDGE